MARISVIGTPFERALLQDLEKKQSLREHTINPPGQERYIQPIDEVELKSKLQEIAAANGGAESDVTDSDVDTFIANTVGSDDISLGTIQTQADGTFTSTGTSTSEAQELQDIISYLFVETGKFLLSFDGGVVNGMLNVTDADGNPAPWIKVFTDDGTALFSL